jgi:GTP-binding protein
VIPVLVIAIVGRPNVGKSTLFNQLTKSREALVVDLPGVTRDRQYGAGKIGSKPFIVIDTGGVGVIDSGIDNLMADQSWQAVEDADIILFLVDGRSGLVTADQDVALKLRQKDKPVYLVVNKTDGLNTDIAVSDFYALGIKGEPIPIAASHGRGVTHLIETVLESYPLPPEEDAEDLREKENFAETGIKIAIAGRPNVGKSTLVNRMLGEERVVVFDEPGTTRDSIYIPLERFGTKYTLIDTAGVRRRARISETVEKFSVVKTLKAIDDCHVVILVLDARAGVTDQDLGLLGYILETGRALVVAINKWDGLDMEQKESVKKTLNYRLTFADFATVHYISALHGSGVGNLFDSVHKAYQSATKELSTNELTRVLIKAVALHTPPMVRGRRIKLRYAHAGGHRPPLIIIHGNQTEEVPETYKRYLMNVFRIQLKLEGTPIRIQFKTSTNPYEGKRNPLTPRQEYKRKRLKNFVKKKK